MKRTWTARLFLLGLLAALALSACSPAAVPTSAPTRAAPAATAVPAAPPSPTPAPKPAAVKFGAASSASDAGIYVAIEKGYFKEQGLDVQYVTFQSGAMTIAPLSSGEIDAAGGAISTGLLNAIERGVALKIVAGKGSSTKGFEFSQVTVRKDLIDSGQVKEVKDLKGKKIAVGSLQSGPEATVAYLLKQAGLSIKDVELLAMGYPDMVAAYANKAIDAAQQIEPNLNAAVERGLAARWPPGATSSIYGGEYQSAQVFFSEQFTKNVDAARRFMIAYLKGARDYNDAFVKGKNKSEVVSMLTKYTPEKDPALYEKMQLPYIDPDGKMNTASMKMQFDYFKEMGYYTGKLELQSIIDTQAVEYAAKQLGPYK